MTTALPVAWLIARAAGLTAFGLLTLSVWLGLAMSTRLLGPKRQKALLGLHRTLVWTGLSMVGLHVVALMLDPVMHFNLLSVLVPFAAPWKSGASRRRRHRRLAQPRPGGLVQDAKVDRPEGLAPAPLRELRRLRPLFGTRALRRYRPARRRRACAGAAGGRSGALALVLPAPHAEVGPAPAPRPAPSPA